MIDSRWDDPDFDDEGKVDVEHYPLPPGLIEVWAEVLAEDGATTRKARARHKNTGFGHRDNLKPGMRLQLRKGDCRPGEDHEVSVLDGGKFGWDGNEYPNGNQLLKAITKRAQHRLTVRRYFSLGGEKSRSLIPNLRKALLGSVIVAKREDTVYLTGDLSGAGIPEHLIQNSDSLELSTDEANELLNYLDGGDNE